MQNLNLYMRAVAVTALIVVGGVGVYKGRGMMSAKADPAKADAAKTETGESATASTNASESAASATAVSSDVTPNIAKIEASDKTSVPKPSAFGKKSSTSSDANDTAASGSEKKASKFKFGSFGKSEGKAADSGEPAEPRLGTASSRRKSAGLSDAPPGESKFNEYAAVVADATGATENAGGYAAPTTGDGSTYGGLAEAAGPDAATAQTTGSVPSAASEFGAPSVATPLAEASGGYQENAYQNEVAQSAPRNDGRVPQSSYAAGDTIADANPETTSLADATSASTPPQAPLAESPLAAASSLADVPRPFPKNPNALPANPLPLATPLAAERAATSPRYSQDVATNTDLAGNGSANATDVQPHMQGPQTPSITVQKYAPEEVQVGKPALFEIEVRNVGKVAAYDVTVVDEVPRGTRLAQANPAPTQGKTGALTWKLGTLKPGETQVIELQLVPETEGEIGSVAQVSFQAQAAVKSIVTRAKLEIRHSAPTQVHAGETAKVTITISNSGSGAATNVVLQCDVPDGFSHPQGRELELAANTLRPGEEKQFQLDLKAEKAGRFEGVFVAQADGNLTAQAVAPIEIVSPSLNVSVTGPKKRFVERQATHAITISNPGTAAAKGIDLVVYLPRGLKFVSADNRGQYDARQHAVAWGLEELPANASGNVQLTTLPIEAGDQKMQVEAKSANGLSAQFEQVIAVDAVAELPFSVHDLADPIEVGSEAGYEVRVSNRGAKDATNVQVVVAFPKEMRPIDGDGAAKAVVNGSRVEFAPIGKLAPGQEVTLRIRGQGLRAGDHRVAVSITSEENPTPVTREESTRVYADQ